MIFAGVRGVLGCPPTFIYYFRIIWSSSSTKPFTFRREQHVGQELITCIKCAMLLISPYLKLISTSNMWRFLVFYAVVGFFSKRYNRINIMKSKVIKLHVTYLCKLNLPVFLYLLISCSWNQFVSECSTRFCIEKKIPTMYRFGIINWSFP